MEHESVLSGDAGVAASRLDDSDLLDNYSRAVTQAVERVSGSLVKIDVQSARRANRPGQEGSGSGFVFTPDGLILTNSHVVHQAAKISLTFTDGSRSGAVLIGEDRDTDIAVLRTEHAVFSPAPLGSLETIAHRADCDRRGQSVRLSVLGDGGRGQRARPQYARLPPGA